MRAPTDAALPRFALLLDPDAMTPVLERSLGRAARVEQVRIARVAYKPGDRANVHYEALVDGRVEDAVTWAVAGRDLSARARQPALLELARRVDGRSPAVRPLVYEPDADALVTWLPLDPRLPALVRLPSAPVVRVAESYKPGVRIVLRSDRRVLKAYGKDRAFELAVAGLRLAAASPLRAPRLEAAYPRLRLTAQTAVEGTVPTPESAAQAAGALVRRLQAAPLAPARVRRAETVLALAAEKARLVALLLPALGARLRRLLEQLRKSAPSGEALVPAHGDFDADQLVDPDDGELVVLDFDDVCLAPPAFDLATYLADVARGREQDAAAIEAVRAPLLAGYGAHPAALDWYLAAVVLTRAPHAFQRGLSDWPERVDGMVRTAEEVLAG